MASSDGRGRREGLASGERGGDAGVGGDRGRGGDVGGDTNRGEREEEETMTRGLHRERSWNEQDMKRVMQERLLGGEVGRESGFSEKG